MESSFHKLPTELLVDIFLDAIGGPAGWTLQKLHELAKVCKRWRDIILRTPHLWCTIQSWASPKYNDRVLKRNQWGPLMVRSNFQRWLEEMAARSRPDRWIALEFASYYYSPSLQRIVNSATGLQHLTIALDNADAKAPSIAIPNPAKLRTLHLRSFHIPWTGLDSLRLESLWLEHLYTFPTDDQISGVLRSSPCLRRLVLRNFYLDGHFFYARSHEEQPFPEPLESDPIDLPCLETLLMISVPSSLCHSLLWRLCIPSCKTIHLDDCHSTHFGEASSSKLPETLGRVLGTAKQIRLTCEAQVVHGNYPISIQTLDPQVLKPHLPLRLSGCSGLSLRAVLPRLDAWNDLAEAIGLNRFTGTATLSLDHPTVIVIGSQVDHAATPFIQRIARDMGQSIDVLEWRTNPLPVLQYLSVPQQVAGAEAVKHWPCPKLRRIFISSELRWLEVDRDELLQWCITVLRRSSAKVGSLAAPRQLEEFLWPSSLGISEKLCTLDEFRSVKFLYSSQD